MNGELRDERNRDPSQWETTCTTPMTTQPHFDKRSPSPVSPAAVRPRSRTVGSDSDTAEDLRPLLIPHLKHEDTNSEIHDSYSGESNPTWVCVLYGLINATIVLPVLLAFGAIIYRDQAFAPYMPVLMKLTLVSGMVHQLCFSTFSTLPFAVGQVQDTGLIFLSGMASAIVQYCQVHGLGDEVMLATATIGLALCTALLGVGLVVCGKLRLAQYVQMLPTSVVGGYLAFIGWFCGSSGVLLMVDADPSDLTLQVFLSKIRLVLPGILGGTVIYGTVRRLKHMAVLPCLVITLLVLFYFILWLKGASVADVTEQGWIRKMDPAPVWYHTWDYVQFDRVAWSALPSLTLTQFWMTCVCALSSSLDVAAIELELKRPLDYNHELTTVGVSNIVSGLTGGYTGSYIFSQSIFSLRAGIRSRLAGYVLAATQAATFLIPVPLLAYVPNFFFGSLLTMISIDLMVEWLWDVRDRLRPVEYAICLSTFSLIQLLGVEYGIFAGVGLYVACRWSGLDVGRPIHTNADIMESEVSMNGSDHTRRHRKYGTISRYD